MSSDPTPDRPPAEAGTRPRGRSWRGPVMLYAGLGGAIAGALLVRSGRPSMSPRGAAFAPMLLSLGLWLVLSLYWEWAARGASAAASVESSGSRRFHLLLVSAAQLLSFWPFAGWPTVEHFRFEFPRVLPDLPFLAPLGLAVGAGSLVLAIWARRHLGRHWSGAVTAKVDHELVRTGPYRRIRHPIYTGAIGMYVGTAIISGRLQGLLAIAIISTAYVRKIGLEERNLRGVFGAIYDDYRRDSWALLPGLY